MSLQNSLPTSMLYSITGSDSIPSRTRLSRFDATNSSYNSGSNNKILIPVSADGFIDTSKSYLYFKLTNNSTSAADAGIKLDGNAACVIDKLEIAVAGSSIVETIDRYNIYHLMEQDWNSSINDLTFSQAVYGGGAPALEAVSQGAAVGEGGSSHFCVKLNCAFLNSYYHKALPMGLPQITIQITLASGVQALIAQNADLAVNTYSLDEVRYYAPVYTILDEQIMAQYSQQISSSPTAFIGQSAGTIINSVAAQTGKQTLQLNASYKSLNAMVTMMRPSANLNNKVKNVLTAFNLTNVGGYRHTIQGQLYPADEIDFSATNTGRAYMEASKAWAPHGKKYAVSSCITLTRFKANDAAGDNVGSGQMAVDLKRFSDERLVNLGLDTSGSGAPSTIEINFSGGAPAAQDVTTYALHDRTFIMLPNGTVEAVF